MSKEELIKYCVNNNYTFTETPSEIRVDKIIDKLENIVFAFAYYKEDKSIKFLVMNKVVKNLAMLNTQYLQT